MNCWNKKFNLTPKSVNRMHFRNILMLFILLYGLKAGYGQGIVITEIFADPKPSKGLPEVEFLEIYNATDKIVSLKGYSLIYGNTVSAFPDSSIGIGEFRILVQAGFVNDFKPFGQVIGLPRLSLNNNGNTLRIINAKGEEEHFVAYQPGWYAAGKSKGYSLEMIDLNLPCVGKANWTSSQSEVGATPGRKNSVASDQGLSGNPELIGSSFQNGRLTLLFDRNMNSSMTEELGHYEVIEGGGSIGNVEFGAGSREILTITLKNNSDDILKFRVYEPTDCMGNVGEDLNLSFLNLPEPQAGDIQISEVLFNPKAGGEDFVELHNISQQPFNLKNWMLAHRNSKGETASWKVLSSFDLILDSEDFMAFTSNKSFLLENYPFTGKITEISSLPPYNNDAGTVFLLKPDSTVFDNFSYTEKMHSQLINNFKGVSLEKVSFKPKQNQWTSASSDMGFASPGLPNSQTEDGTLEQYFRVEPLVFNPFQTNDKPVTQLQYKLKKSGCYASIHILDKTGKIVRTIGSNLQLGTHGGFEWDGTDDSGGLLPVGYYIFVANVFNNGYQERFIAKVVIGSY